MSKLLKTKNGCNISTVDTLSNGIRAICRATSRGFTIRLLRTSFQSGIEHVIGQHLTELTRGPAYSFADWPNPSVPTFGAGVYTIWHKDGRFIYIGMSGRGMTADTIRRNTAQGIYTV